MKMTKNFDITIDISVARKMLNLAGYWQSESSQETDDEIFKKVLSMIDCYGASFNERRKE